MHGSDPFLLQLLAIFVAAKLGGELFEQLRMPGVLGEILAGVLLGPFALNWVAPEGPVLSVGELGAIFLLFSVGLETRPNELIEVGRRSLGVALGGVLLPFAFGFGYFILTHHSPHESTFVATAMVATSVGITARVMSDIGVMHTRPAKIILAAAVFDDILGMVLLAIVAGLASEAGVSWPQLGLLMGEAVAFALVMIFIAPRLMRRVRPGLDRVETKHAPLVLALGLCLALSVAAEKIGMAAIVGAFFAGLVFAEYSPEFKLTGRVGAITEFLAPFFFFTMGARLNLGVLKGEVVLTAVVITVLAIVSKLLGCGLPVLREGWRTALKVGVGMMPRGEVGLIVALIGLNMKIVSDHAYAVVMIMTGATTLLAPLLLRTLFHQLPQESAVAVPAVRRETAV